MFKGLLVTAVIVVSFSQSEAFAQCSAKRISRYLKNHGAVTGFVAEAKSGNRRTTCSKLRVSVSEDTFEGYISCDTPAGRDGIGEYDQWMTITGECFDSKSFIVTDIDYGYAG